ncbi:hypothetical protein FEM48_Zijuj05G0112200 [Ziziphus jujuba var. spinosa]|uniref:Tetrapyrrole methylase domain-containing protein n=1 Tax=Ziziphus jujuba var. spinosa TaxID=714518 RepID=A0A978VEM4_ZIZJJ|nr:hypothetical protein FEM48_Zijuj05G0112200 [Ziziphus jujuba var. spinosa]
MEAIKKGLARDLPLSYSWAPEGTALICFTSDKHSIERYQRYQWLYKNQFERTSLCLIPPDFNSTRENDITLQLPELKKLLQMVREKRESKGGNYGHGNVFLVGTGPEDPELLTLKAVRVIHSADLLFFADVGAIVVGLKGGDPLVFGRGGEEMDFMQWQRIEVNIIPGITTTSEIAAELGIPLKHRGVANSIKFLTRHSRRGGTDPLFIAENATELIRPW